jgi:pimeloyl-ACP methyl ester carboxylesterase
MAYLDFGPADRPVDVVFLHANGFNARAYRTLLAPLADRWRILAPDQRGHGATSLPARTERRASWYDLADDLLTFLTALDVGRAALAGHSMGGTVCLLAAAVIPDKVRALSLFDPVVRPRSVMRGEASPGPQPTSLIEGALRRRRFFPSRAAASEAYRGRGAFATWPEAVLADYVADGFHDLPDGTVELACPPEWEASNYSSQGHDPWRGFHAGQFPIRILRAGRGSTGQFDAQRAELAATGRVRIETIEGASHFLPMERPDLVRAAIAEAAAAG